MAGGVDRILLNKQLLSLRPARHCFPIEHYLEDPAMRLLPGAAWRRPLLLAATVPFPLLLAACSTEPNSTGNSATTPAGNGTASSGTSSTGDSLFEAPRKADGDITI